MFLSERHRIFRKKPQYNGSKIPAGTVIPRLHGPSLILVTFVQDEKLTNRMVKLSVM